MKGEQVAFIFDWNHYYGCCYAATRFLFPGHFDVRRYIFLHRLLVGIHECFLSALSNKFRERVFHINLLFSRVISQESGEFFITNLVDIIQIDVNRLLGGIQNILHLG